MKSTSGKHSKQVSLRESFAKAENIITAEAEHIKTAEDKSMTGIQDTHRKLEENVSDFQPPTQKIDGYAEIVS